MKPGHPFAFGILQRNKENIAKANEADEVQGARTTATQQFAAADAFVFGLPGNPVSSMVTFEQLVRPAMLKMSGHRSYGRPVVQAIFQEKFSKRTDRRHFLRGVLVREGGTFTVRTTGDQGSGILTSMVKANCLIDVPVEVERLSPGDEVSVQLLSGEAWASHADSIQTGPHRLSCC